MPKFILLILILAISFFVAGYLYSPGTANDGVFVVEPGESVDSMTERLAQDGFIRSKLLFKWELSKNGLATKLQPGEHNLAGANTLIELAERLTVRQMTRQEVTLLVREGENLRHIKTALEQIGLIEAANDLELLAGKPATFPNSDSVDDYINKLKTDSFAWLETLPPGAGLEGFLFPDTYRFFSDSSADDVIVKMVANFDKKLTEQLRADIENSGRSLYEVIIMASILEREVRGLEDMKMVSDLFWRRFDIGMGLQADSTVNYVTGGKSPAITYEETKLDSAYNTYKWRGLPPGPIGNPGLDAITAAVYPTANDYWYFLTDQQGQIYFGRDLNEHNQNKARYL